MTKLIRQNLVIDQIPLDHLVEINNALDDLQQRYNIRIRIKRDGRTNQPLYDRRDYELPIEIK